MKEFFYLDTSFLHSFLAQINGGLPSSISKETQESRTETHSDTSTKERGLEFHAGIKAFGSVGAKWRPKKSSGETVSLAQFEAGKEIISRQLHDNAVDDLISHLRNNDLLVENLESMEVGKYILIKSKFSVIDLEFMKGFTTKEFSQLMSSLAGAGGKGKQPLNTNEIGKILNFLSTILPSDIYIKQEGILSPLRAEHLRTKTKEVLFKYGNDAEITLLGKVTREIDILPRDLDNFEFKNIISMSDMMVGLTGLFLSQFGMAEPGDYIVSPVSIFFESA